jgi:hypothetical protein
MITTGPPSMFEDGHPVAQRNRKFASLVELHEFPVMSRGSIERKHRRLSTGDQDRVETINVECR